MDQKDEVKSKVDIVEVISSYLPLKKAGRNFSGLCPFHSEKTPSFMVSAERQVFKCFGCGEFGDVFTFLEKIEGWDFRDALEELAKRVGVKLKKFAPTGQTQVKEKLIEINKLTARFYSHLLTKHPIGEPARKYLNKRGIKPPMWEKFSLGFAPDSWDKTVEFLKSRKVRVEDIAQAGLIIDGKRGFYDRFRGRIMFPLKDSRGTVLGFAGRVIETSDKGHVTSDTRQEAKYINSPETPIFNKGSLLFGLDAARSAIREKNEAVLVEGEFDVLSAHASGIANVVASKGTALTDKQVATISHICENVALCLDADIAGDAASRRGIELLDFVGLNIKVVNLGKFKDPDEYVRADAAGFMKAISIASNIYDYLIDSATARFDPATPSGKKAIGREILPRLAKITDDLVRAHYIEKLSRVLDLDVSLVADAVSKKSDGVQEGEFATVVLPKSGLFLEQYFLALLIFGEEIAPKLVNYFKAEDFEDKDSRAFWEFLRGIIQTRLERGKKSDTGLFRARNSDSAEDETVSEARKREPRTSGSGNLLNIKGLIAKLPKNLNKFVDDLYLVDVRGDFSDRDMWAAEIVKIATRVKKESLKRQLGVISRGIKEAQSEEDEKRVSKLSEQFDVISKNIKEEFTWH